MFWYFLWTGINLMMHISLCIFANSLLFISWPICKYLESHFLKAYLKLRCGFGVLFVCLFWLGVGGEKGFCTLITQMEIPYGLKKMSYWKQFKYQKNYFRLRQNLKRYWRKIHRNETWVQIPALTSCMSLSKLFTVFSILISKMTVVIMYPIGL